MGTMKTETLELLDMFGLAKGKAEEVATALEGLLKRTVKRELTAEMAERIEARVEKEVAKEVRVLEAKGEQNATKADLHTLREDVLSMEAAIRDDMNTMGNSIRRDMHAMEHKLTFWVVGVLITMLVGFLVTVVSINASLRAVPQTVERTATP